MNLNIVLYQPEIPQNTGNIARTCVLTDSTLHLIKPLGFDIDERIFLASTHGGKYYSDETYKKGDFIMFGRESSGVPQEVHEALNHVRIPMVQTTTRSLNVSNTAAIIAYEVLRQIEFPNMK